MAADPTPNDEPAAAARQPAHVRRYPVRKANGKTVHQIVLVVSDPDENGAVRGFPIGFEEHAGRFLPGAFAD